MDSQFIQTIRYKLQRRVRRVNSVEGLLVVPALKHFWHFVRGSELFRSILEPALRHRDDLALTAEGLMKGEKLYAETELEGVGVAYHVLQKLLSENEPGDLYLRFSARLFPGDTSARLDAFRATFVEPIYEYLDEQLDDQRAVLALLIRYKHRTEWFNRENVRRLAEADSARAERVLATDLYRYLHDQGMDFRLAPSSPSGEIDLLQDQAPGNRLALDAKVFDPPSSRGRSYLAKGFNQVYAYVRDHNESAGYLAIFRMSESEPRFTFAQNDSVFPCYAHNGKLIYFAVIDLFEHDVSASKRGPGRVIEISPSDLLTLDPSSGLAVKPAL